MKTRQFVAGLAAVCLVAGACAESEEPDMQVEELRTIDLPTPDVVGHMSFEQTLSSRRSVRDFTDETLSIGQIGQLFWAAQGETRPNRRTNPSAGALYPIEIYAATPDGLYRYLPSGHRAELLTSDDIRNHLYWSSYLQDSIADAPVVFVVCGVYSRTEEKYGGRADRYVKLEAGHVAQSLLLQAVALELGAVPVGAFQDGQVQRALGVPDDHEPLYLIPVGHPA